jgi:hypothetical protein
MAAIQILRAINVNDRLSIPENEEIDTNVNEFIYLTIKIGTIIIIDDVISHHLDFNEIRSIVEIRGKVISSIILLLRLLYLTLWYGII